MSAPALRRRSTAEWSTDHFIRALDLSIEHPAVERSAGGERVIVRAAVAQRPDFGLLATIVDVAGGGLAGLMFPGVPAPTTNLEVRGMAALNRPGELVVDARAIAASKRRITIELSIQIGGAAAYAVAAFALRPTSDGGLNAAGDPEQPPPLLQPQGVPGPIVGELWQRLGVERSPDASTLAIGPYVYNNYTALQGGATATVLAAAAESSLVGAARIVDGSVQYHRQVVGQVAVGRVRGRLGDTLRVDVTADDGHEPCATALFTVGPH